MSTSLEDEGSKPSTPSRTAFSTRYDTGNRSATNFLLKRPRVTAVHTTKVASNLTQSKACSRLTNLIHVLKTNASSRSIAATPNPRMLAHFKAKHEKFRRSSFVD
jgi:hypothetical protein